MGNVGNTKKNDQNETGPSFLNDMKNGRILQIDLLKGLAIISVILIHTFSAIVLEAIGAPYHILQAVPIFLMLAALGGALAYHRIRKNTLEELFNRKILCRRFKRILLPFIVVCIAQVILIVWILPKDNPVYLLYSAASQIGILTPVIVFLVGGAGPGIYFIPLILLQILLIPVFYWLAVRYSPDFMLVLVFLVNIGIQYMWFIVGIPQSVFGANYLNYMFLAALGIWLALKTDGRPALIVSAGLISLAYITAVYYGSFQFHFVSPGSSIFTEFSYFWTTVLVICGLHYLPRRRHSATVSIVAELGKASWHIFLVQMAYLGLFNNQLIDAAIGATSMLGGIIGDVIAQSVLTLSTLVVCSVIGYWFYRGEEYMKQRWPTLFT